MDNSRKITLSGAAFVLVCFFLPWVEVSCMGVRDLASGFDLARGGSRPLWLIPGFMSAIIFTGLARFIRERMPFVFALTGTVGGTLGAYLMIREFASTNRTEKLIPTQWTLLFWLAVIASLITAVTAFRFYALRSRSP